MGIGCGTNMNPRLIQVRQASPTQMLEYSVKRQRKLISTAVSVANICNDILLGPLVT